MTSPASLTFSGERATRRNERRFRRRAARHAKAMGELQKAERVLDTREAEDGRERREELERREGPPSRVFEAFMRRADALDDGRPRPERSAKRLFEPSSLVDAARGSPAERHFLPELSGPRAQGLHHRLPSIPPEPLPPSGLFPAPAELAAFARDTQRRADAVDRFRYVLELRAEADPVPLVVDPAALIAEAAELAKRPLSEQAARPRVVASDNVSAARAVWLRGEPAAPQEPPQAARRPAPEGPPFGSLPQGNITGPVVQTEHMGRLPLWSAERFRRSNRRRQRVIAAEHEAEARRRGVSTSAIRPRDVSVCRRLSDCESGGWLVAFQRLVRHRESGKPIQRTIRCHHRLCDVCARDRSFRVRSELEPFAREVFGDGRPAMWTLTQDDRPGEPIEEATERFFASLTSMTSREWWRRHVVGAILGIEVVRSTAPKRLRAYRRALERLSRITVDSPRRRRLVAECEELRRGADRSGSWWHVHGHLLAMARSCREHAELELEAAELELGAAVEAGDDGKASAALGRRQKASRALERAQCCTSCVWLGGPRYRRKGDGLELHRRRAELLQVVKAAYEGEDAGHTKTAARALLTATLRAAELGLPHLELELVEARPELRALVAGPAGDAARRLLADLYREHHRAHRGGTWLEQHDALEVWRSAVRVSALRGLRPFQELEAACSDVAATRIDLIGRQLRAEKRRQWARNRLAPPGHPDLEREVGELKARRSLLRQALEAVRLRRPLDDGPAELVAAVTEVNDGRWGGFRLERARGKRRSAKHEEDGQRDALSDGLEEVLKYITKPAELVTELSHEERVELVGWMRGRRLLRTYGAMRGIAKRLDELEADEAYEDPDALPADDEVIGYVEDEEEGWRPVLLGEATWSASSRAWSQACELLREAARGTAWTLSLAPLDAEPTGPPEHDEDKRAQMDFYEHLLRTMPSKAEVSSWQA